MTDETSALNPKLIGFFLSVVLSMLIAGIAFYVYQEEIRNLRKNIAIEQMHHLENQTTLIREDFKHCAYALLLLSKYVRLHTPFATTTGWNALHNEFISFLDSSNLYDQIRVMDIHGRQVLGAGYYAGAPGIMPETELKQRGEHEYFIRTVALDANEVYISAMEFTSRHGKSELSMQPMIQFGMPLFDLQGQKTGIITLNYFAGNMLTKFKKVAGFEGVDKGESMLLTHDGYWLVGPGLQQSWDSMFADHIRNYLEIISQEAWVQISSQQSGHFIVNGDQYHFTTLSPAEMISSISRINNYTDPLPTFWKVVSRYPQKVFAHTIRETRNTIILFTLSFLVLINSMFWLLARTITRRRQTERELHLSEENYRLHINSVSDVVYSIDPAFHIIDISPSVEAMLGYKPKELLGRPLKQLHLMTEESARRAMVDIRSIVKGQVVKSRALTFIAKDGTHCIGEGSVAPYFTHGKISGFAGVIRDITERRKMEEQLRESEDRLREIFTAANDAIFIVDAQNDEIIKVNPRAVSMLGYSIEEFSTLRISEMATGEAGDQLAFFLQETANFGQGATCECILRNKDGDHVPTELSTAPVQLGGHTLILAMVRDITDRKRAEGLEKLQTQERERASRLMILGRMSAEIAHELHQPLSAILSYADTCSRLMKHGELQADKLGSILGKISAQADRAGHVVRRIGSFTRSQEMHCTTVDLNTLIQETLKLAELETQKYRVETETKLASPLPPVLADHLLIQQVLLNLIRNACQAMQEMEPCKRQLTIKTEQADQEHVMVSICDRGTGLASDELGKMFDPFFSLKEEGMGLGLSMSNAIIGNHGGRLWAKKLAETGLSVCFTLPVVGALCDGK